MFTSAISLTPVVGSNSSTGSGNAASRGEGVRAPDGNGVLSLAVTAKTGQRPPLPGPAGAGKRPHDAIADHRGVGAAGTSAEVDPQRPSLLTRVTASGKGGRQRADAFGANTPLVEQHEQIPQSAMPLDENVPGMNARPIVAMQPNKRARSASSFLRFASPNTINVASALSLLSKAVVHNNAQ